MLLHLVGQVLGDGFSPVQHQAVQPHAVVEQICGVVVKAHIQAAVAHDHTVDDLQLPVHLPQVFHRVDVAYLLGHGVGAGLGGENM